VSIPSDGVAFSTANELEMINAVFKNLGRVIVNLGGGGGEGVKKISRG